MKNPLPAILVALVTSAAAFAASAVKVPANPDVLVVADAIADLPSAFRPAPGKPVYYTFSDSRQLSLGGPVDGIKMPNHALVESATEAALAREGFVRATAGGPSPVISIRLFWGDANFRQVEPPLNEASALKSIRFGGGDRWIQRYLLGVHKLETLQKGLAPLPFGSTAFSFDELARFDTALGDDLLFVFVAAFDETAVAAGKSPLLWSTSMAINGRNRLREGLPLMLTSAAPFFGRSLEKPKFVREADRVASAPLEIGDLKVASSEEPSQVAKRADVQELHSLTNAWAQKSRL